MHQMPKKKSSCSSSLKTSSQKELANPAIQLTKRVPKPGKLGKEIDDIFAGRKKKKKPEIEKPVKQEETKAEIAKKKRKRNQLDGLSNNTKTRSRKRTEDGLLVFTEEELGINKAYAGDTHLCPFDCSCCF